MTSTELSQLTIAAPTIDRVQTGRRYGTDWLPFLSFDQ